MPFFASESKFGVLAASSSVRLSDFLGSPPSPSMTNKTIFVSEGFTNVLIKSKSILNSLLSLNLTILFYRLSYNSSNLSFLIKVMYKRKYDITSLVKLKHYLFIYVDLLKEIAYDRKELQMPGLRKSYFLFWNAWRI